MPCLRFTFISSTSYYIPDFGSVGSNAPPLDMVVSPILLIILSLLNMYYTISLTSFSIHNICSHHPCHFWGHRQVYHPIWDTFISYWCHFLIPLDSDVLLTMGTYSLIPLQPSGQPRHASNWDPMVSFVTIFSKTNLVLLIILLWYPIFMWV